MSVDVVIREAREDDVDDVIALNIECLPEHYPLSFWLEHLRKWSKVFLIAEVARRIVGYVMCRIETGTSNILGVKATLGHIVSIAVSKEYRRRGIALKLMQTALANMKKFYGVNEAYLEVRVSNEPAIKLYRKLGFEIIKRLDDYYLDGEDAYLMARLL